MLLGESILFIGDGSPWSHRAAGHLNGLCGDLHTLFWDHGAAMPTKHLDWTGDRIFTFKADLVLPQSVIDSARRSAINFHPGPPHYRGIGGYHYALANGASEFGATCHHIVEKIDYGDIIRVDRFAIAPDDSVDSLTQRTAETCLKMFHDIIDTLRSGEDLPAEKGEVWGEHLHTRKELEGWLRAARGA